MLNELIQMQYDKDNFKVLNISDIRRCIIFCSSNGLWDYSEESFVRDIMEHDKYEWDNIAKHRVIEDRFGRIVFLRDVRLNFYVDGINSSVNSIDELINMIRPLTKDYELTTVGCSSGGYLAMILGMSLNAKKVFSFGGQIDLTVWGGAGNKLHFSDFTALYSRRNKSSYAKWFSLQNIVQQSKTKVYHFYGGKCQADIIQASIMNSHNNIFRFPINSNEHGTVVWGFCIPYLITANEEKLIAFSERNKGKLIENIVIAFTFAGLGVTIKTLVGKAIKKIAK